MHTTHVQTKYNMQSYHVQGVFMAETMKLLEKALQLKTSSDWARDLQLHRNALASAKQRGHLSPSIAGAMAEMLGLDATKWIAVAALESDKDSACKSRMIRKFGRIASL
jgi:hypothetical protein